jgi:hypothetical protein
MATSSDRRVATRRAAHFVAEIEANGVRCGCAVSRDASASGLLLLARTDLEPGTRVVIHLWVPDEEDPRALDGAVVRRESIPAGQSPIWSSRIAVSLDQPPDDLEHVIDQLSKPSENSP